MTLKQCERCEILKPIESYESKGSRICKECKEEHRKQRMERYSKVDLGLDALDSSLELIHCMRNDVSMAYQVSYEKAKNLVQEGRATVYSSDTIYKTEKVKTERFNDVKIEANFTCHYCGEYGDTIDHIIPLDKGGSNAKSNLVCSCRECNELKNNMKYERFMDLMNKYGKQELLKNRGNIQKKFTSLKKVNQEILNNINKKNKNKVDSLDDMINSVLNKKTKW
ncbi:HNH endonuclease [Paenibacillus medicaginis]|uniref:HNH endonuclease n=1 Tax=Paenibacillus medicaginis TaxID=1470560 RepID=A0ABV5BXH1_9BACL